MVDPTEIWHKMLILHPGYLSVVVARGIASVNKNSRSHATFNLPALCGEFTHMVMVTKVHRHGTPCVTLEPEHLPWATTLDATCVGPMGEKAYILWPCNYLIEKGN